MKPLTYVPFDWLHPRDITRSVQEAPADRLFELRGLLWGSAVRAQERTCAALARLAAARAEYYAVRGPIRSDGYPPEESDGLRVYPHYRTMIGIEREVRNELEAALKSVDGGVL